MTELERLVEATRGIQPWRRVFHATLGVIIAWFVGWGSPSHEVTVIVLVSMASAALLLDVVRFSVPSVNALFFRLLSRLASPREAAGIASSTWYLVGIALAVTAFPIPHAVGGILILALADPAASYVGQRWGRHRMPAWMGAGSWEGTAIFLIVAALVLRRAWPPLDAAAAILVATVLERAPWPVDDNLTIPPGVAATLWVMALV